MADEKTLTIARAQLQRVYDAIVGCQSQFFAWFEAAKATERKTDEIYWQIEKIMVDEVFYHCWIKDLPKVEEFTAAEMEQRTGKAERLLYIAEEIIQLGSTLQIDLTKLQSLATGKPNRYPTKILRYARKEN
jgi:hypothetical protein